MSSQGLNATNRNANGTYRFNPTAVNTSPGIPGVGVPAGPYATQFASDNTRRIKEAIFYDQHKQLDARNTNYPIIQSNQNRKTYSFGKLVCFNCRKFPRSEIGAL